MLVYNSFSFLVVFKI